MGTAPGLKAQGLPPSLVSRTLYPASSNLASGNFSKGQTGREAKQERVLSVLGISGGGHSNKKVLADQMVLWGLP